MMPGGILTIRKTTRPSCSVTWSWRRSGCPSRREGDGTAVVFRQLWKGVPVFSNQLTFLYSGGQLRSLTGVVVIGGQAAVEQGNVLTRPTALLRFLDDVLESRDVCTAVLSMKAGYRTAQDLSGTTRLTPYWLISTDTADYYMDAATGDLTRIAGE